MRHTLYPEERGEPIAQTLKQLRDHSYNLDAHAAREGESVKTEIYALTAYILEQVHPEAVRHLYEREGEVAAYDNLRFPYAEGATLSTSKEYAALSPSELFSRIPNIEDAYPRAFNQALKRWLAEEETDGYATHAWRRLSELTGQVHPGSFEEVSRGAAEFVTRGVHTAGKVSWNIMRAIPIAYEARFSRVITPDEFRDLAKEAETLVIMLASMHISSFSNTYDFIRSRASSISRHRQLEYPLELFKLEVKDGEPTIAFDELTVAAYEEYRQKKQVKHVRENESRLGCPARDARVQGATGSPESVVASVHRAYLDLAGKYLVPNLKKYTEGAALHAARDW